MFLLCEYLHDCLVHSCNMRFLYNVMVWLVFFYFSDFYNYKYYTYRCTLWTDNNHTPESREVNVCGGVVLAWELDTSHQTQSRPANHQQHVRHNKKVHYFRQINKYITTLALSQTLDSIHVHLGRHRETLAAFSLCLRADFEMTPKHVFLC